MIKSAFFKLFLIAISLTIFPGHAQIKTWTHFRGNNLDGLSSSENAPIKWSGDSNLVWKVVIHDKGWSSPVVYDDQIWMTTAKPEGEKMYTVCVNYNTGEIIHDILLFEPDSIYRKHGLNSFATPTPAIEDGQVYVHFGRYGTACIDTENGNIKWQRERLALIPKMVILNGNERISISWMFRVPAPRYSSIITY
jgi:outer membrane protein assembly factor BamB